MVGSKEGENGEIKICGTNRSHTHAPQTNTCTYMYHAQTNILLLQFLQHVVKCHQKVFQQVQVESGPFETRDFPHQVQKRIFWNEEWRKWILITRRESSHESSW